MRKPRGRASGDHPSHRASEDDSGGSRIGGFSDEFILETIQVWQPRSQLRLDIEDARQIIENIVGFFNLLSKWECSKREAAHRTEEGR